MADLDADYYNRRATSQEERAALVLSVSRDLENWADQPSNEDERVARHDALGAMCEYAADLYRRASDARRSAFGLVAPKPEPVEQ